MSETKTIELENIGLVHIHKKARVKNLSISIKPFDGIRVTIPKHLSFVAAEDYLLKKMPWITKGAKKIKDIESLYTIFDEKSVFRTRFRTLELCQHELKTVRVLVTPNRMKVFYPETYQTNNPKVQELIRKAIEKTLLLESKQYLPQRVALLAQKHGFNYQKISFRNAQTRWGSCAYNNNISLNIHLMRLPEHLSDYVILHELCHTREKNHGPKFKALLNQVTGGAKQLESEIKKYRIAIY